jgi:hypothetical protein
VFGLQQTIADVDGVGSGECSLAPDHLDPAFFHRAGQVARDILDYRLLAINQRGPVKFGLSNRDMMHAGALDLVQGMTGRHQYLLGRAAAVRTGAAEVTGFDHGDRQTGAPCWSSHADAGIAAAQDYDVEWFCRHRSKLASGLGKPAAKVLRAASGPVTSGRSSKRSSRRPWSPF